MKTARRSWGDPYECKKPWPEDDCFVQCGDNGVVFNKGGIEDIIADPVKGLTAVVEAKAGAKSPEHYTTAFFEAFPRTPMSTFLRGEGATVEEAEAATWAQYEKLMACPADHTVESSFEKRSYTNGLGFCTTCGISKSKAFAPWEPCVDCGTKTFWGEDRAGQLVCEECWELMPIERWSDTTVVMRCGNWKDAPWNDHYTREQIEAEDKERRAERNTP